MATSDPSPAASDPHDAPTATARCSCSLATWLWLIAAVVVIVAGFAGFDRWFYEHVSLVLNNEARPLDRGFYAVTKPFWETCRWVFGSPLGVLVLFGGAVFLRPTRWRLYAAGLIGITVAALLANVAQGAIGRLRPNQAASAVTFAPPFSELLTKERVCFPSGEAATAFALACVAAGLLPRWRAAFYAVAGLTAAARLVNGAHYVSDVVAGAVFGVVVAGWLFRWLSRLSSGAQVERS